MRQPDRRDAPAGAARDQFYYGENAFQVAGRIAEVVTNQPCRELFRERIGVPLGMADTHYGDSPNPLLGGGAIVAFSPYPGHAYGLGNWIDRADPAGAPLQNSSQGLFGFTPWIDWERGIAGVFLVYDRAGRVQVLVAGLQSAVRAAIDAGPVCRPRGWLPLILR